ncbi:dienelactone hydrolase family protein [Myxococcus sp. K38C18041901]|uniref:dienelactone hydrolase family protein n=1 Tax=Myxococcus guangdongensis TaxID=2906760 RepID=UPI0020A7645F|nr:dienelactone hydrolase family protein [Myxococcus guangdongensis]MCP3059136.1 dienelactone hydrolase family protein [Myxococcus guangdongensis]
MAGQARLTGKQGQELAGYLSEATRAKGAVVLVHEWWGLNEHIRGIADRLAKEGFTVFATDLYGGRTTKDAQEADKLLSQMDWGKASQALKDATDALRQRGGAGTKVAVLGFCMGGALTLLAGANDAGLDAVVPFYGIPPDTVDVTRIRAPILGHFATKDDWCTPERVDALEAKLKKANVPAELHRYDANHAFFNDTRPEVYSPDNAQRAWTRTVDFLRAKLG